MIHKPVWVLYCVLLVISTATIAVSYYQAGTGTDTVTVPFADRIELLSAKADLFALQRDYEVLVHGLDQKTVEGIINTRIRLQQQSQALLAAESRIRTSLNADPACGWTTRYELVLGDKPCPIKPEVKSK